jgi:pimeloyl-ACP methyl ester carboxylesterase
MATYALIHGAGSSGWYWHLVEPRLRAGGHDVVAPDLPCDDDAAELSDYVDTVVDAIGDLRNVVVVAQSLAGFTAPLVTERVPVDLLVLVAAMVPATGESPGDWWENTRWSEARRAYAVSEGRDPDDEDPVELFLHDLPPAVRQQAMTRVREQSGTPFEKPWPMAAWPDVPTRFLLCRHDRFFPADFQRRVVRERLGITPDEMDGGHLPALAQPDELVTSLESYRSAISPP